MAECMHILLDEESIWVRIGLHITKISYFGYEDRSNALHNVALMQRVAANSRCVCKYYSKNNGRAGYLPHGRFQRLESLRLTTQSRPSNEGES